MSLLFLRTVEPFSAVKANHLLGCSINDKVFVYNSLVLKNQQFLKMAIISTFLLGILPLEKVIWPNIALSMRLNGCQN